MSTTESSYECACAGLVSNCWGMSSQQAQSCDPNETGTYAWTTSVRRFYTSPGFCETCSTQTHHYDESHTSCFEFCFTPDGGSFVAPWTEEGSRRLSRKMLSGAGDSNLNLNSDSNAKVVLPEALGEKIMGVMKGN